MCHFVLHGSKCCVYLEVMPAHSDHVDKFILVHVIVTFLFIYLLCYKN